jgi:long-subunit fatty acid transport protein
MIDPSFENHDGETFSVTDKVTKFDFGGLVETGGSYKLKDRFLLSASFAYQQSFTTITNEDYFSNGKAKHYGMRLAIGLKYALTKE